MSAVYRYFTQNKIEGKAKCNLCKSDVSQKDSSTKGLWDHLRYKHSKQYFELRLEEQPKKRQTEEQKGPTLENANERKKPTLDEVVVRKKKEDLHPAEIKVAKIVARQNLSFRVAEDPDFVDLIQRSFPGFKGLKRERLRKVVIPELAQQLLCPLLHDLKRNCFSITTDGWEKPSQTPALISVTVHFVDENFKRINKILAVTPIITDHTGENIKKCIEEVFNEQSLEFNKVVAVVRDGATNFSSFCQKASLENVHCAAHVLALIVKDCILSDVEVDTNVKKLRKVVEFLHRSNVGRRIFHEIQEKLNEKYKKQVPPSSYPVKKIPMDVKTRWNSTYLMLLACKEQREALVCLQKHFESKKSSFELPEKQFFLSLSKLVPLLKVFYDMTNWVSSEDSTISCFIFILKKIYDKLVKLEVDPKFADISEIIGQLKNETNNRLLKIMFDDILCFSTCLDPRFKNDTSIKSKIEWDELYEKLPTFAYNWKTKIECPVSTTITEPLHIETEVELDQEMFSGDLISPAIQDFEDIDIFDESDAPAPSQTSENLADPLKIKFLQEFKVELLHFRDLPNIERSADIFNWFKDRKDDFPKITACARILHSIPCSSVSSERLFSQATLLYSNKLRNRMGAKSAQNLLLIKSSLKDINIGFSAERNETIDESESESNESDSESEFEK